jgi:hypothetical protein
MPSTITTNSNSSFLAKNGSDQLFALTLEQVSRHLNFDDLTEQSFVPLLDHSEALNLAKSVCQKLAQHESVFGIPTVTLELVQAHKIVESKPDDGSAYYLASVSFPDRPYLDTVEGSFVKHKRSPRGIILVDQEGVPNALAFDAPNWLNKNAPKGVMWVKTLELENPILEFRLPNIDSLDS